MNLASIFLQVYVEQGLGIVQSTVPLKSAPPLQPSLFFLLGRSPSNPNIERDIHYEV